MFVNGRELTRVTTYSNGVEIAQLSWTPAGGFQ
jgi:hypothetical protein